MQEKLFGQLSFNVLVFGFYGKQNLGDDLFCIAFEKLFPNLTFSFVDELTVDNTKNAFAIFIGGGSFLSSPILVSEECLNIVRTKTVLYIGIGAETEIHSSHAELMILAKLIAIRSECGIEQVKKLNENVIIIPDLVYSLVNYPNKLKRNKSVLILPNIYTVPNNTDPHWKHNSWNHFKFEFAQFLDYLHEDNYSIKFFSMCYNIKQNDFLAASEIINCMKYRNSENILKINTSLEDILNIFSNQSIVITQRFHGAILAEVARVPYISIHHHDKLKTSHLNEGIFISYYASSKQTFIDGFNDAINKEIHQNIAIEPNVFNTLKDRVNSALFAR